MIGLHSILEATPLEKVLREFQEKKIQIALVKNYDGMVTGLVTMEDILEEVVGEIRDEETMEAAVGFAETGHLCLSTLHANNANQAIERIMNFFAITASPTLAGSSLQLPIVPSSRRKEPEMFAFSPMFTFLIVMLLTILAPFLISSNAF